MNVNDENRCELSGDLCPENGEECRLGVACIQPAHRFPEGQWVSVREGMPGPDERVLVSDGVFVWVGEENENGVLETAEYPGAHITHWMRLPAPPEWENG